MISSKHAKQCILYRWSRTQKYIQTYTVFCFVYLNDKQNNKRASLHKWLFDCCFLHTHIHWSQPMSIAATATITFTRRIVGIRFRPSVIRDSGFIRHFLCVKVLSLYCVHSTILQYIASQQQQLSTKDVCLLHHHHHCMNRPVDEQHHIIECMYWNMYIYVFVNISQHIETQISVLFKVFLFVSHFFALFPPLSY